MDTLLLMKQVLVLLTVELEFRIDVTGLDVPIEIISLMLSVPRLEQKGSISTREMIQTYSTPCSLPAVQGDIL